MPDRLAATEMTYTGMSSDSSYGLFMSSPSFYAINFGKSLCYPCRARRSSSSRGSLPAVAIRRSSSADLALPLSSCGTVTSSVARRSPSVPSLRRTPRPGTRITVPFAEPGLTRTVTAGPRCVGTLMSAPSASSVIVTGTVTVRLSPFLPNTSCGLTCTRTYRSPALPPCSPGAPLPGIRIRCPSATPAGMRAWMVRELIARPLPLHDGHGSSTTSPRPRQVLQGSESPKPPRFLACCPVPWQSGQTLGTVPDFAPVPPQTGQGPSPVSRRVTVAPSIESPNDSVVSVSTSAPRRARLDGPPPCRLRKMPPSTSPRPSPLPKRSPRSNVDPPAPVRPPPVGTRNPPNIERASSYSLRCFSSDSTLYASVISLKRSSAAALPLFASG